MKLPEFQITAGFCFTAALGLLVLPWDVLFSFVAASGLHELFHLAALTFCKVPVTQINLGQFGAKISTGFLTPAQELICALAGPVGSLLLVFLSKLMPLLSLFGFCQGVYNLLPIYPLDGGRVVRAILILAKRSG